MIDIRYVYCSEQRYHHWSTEVWLYSLTSKGQSHQNTIAQQQYKVFPNKIKGLIFLQDIFIEWYVKSIKEHAQHHDFLYIRSALECRKNPIIYYTLWNSIYNHKAKTWTLVKDLQCGSLLFQGKSTCKNTFESGSPSIRSNHLPQPLGLMVGLIADDFEALCSAWKRPVLCWNLPWLEVINSTGNTLLSWNVFRMPAL